MLVEKDIQFLQLDKIQEKLQVLKYKPKAIPLKNIDTIGLYLNPARQRDYYNYIIEAKPKRVILILEQRILSFNYWN
jgi:hypothetical protein